MPILTVVQGDKKTEIVFNNTPVLDTLLQENGFFELRPCGGKGTCGKCAVQIQGDVSPFNEAEKKIGAHLACQTKLYGDCTVYLKSKGEIEDIAFDAQENNQSISPMGTSYGIAVDIGTTTLALTLHNLKTGQTCAKEGHENPQRHIASDVMGRIDASLKGKNLELKEKLMSVLQSMMLSLCDTAHISFEKDVDALVITGNTTMLYLLTDTNPKSLAFAPFEADKLFGETVYLFGKKTYLPPCISAFVGADITCAILASNMLQKNKTAFLCDIGTNGEMALLKEGVLYTCSTAAGPAFEGATITCGVSGIKGAIDHVYVENGKIKYTTISNAPSVGLCGSGLIDAIDALLQLEILDETGAMDDEQVYLSENVYVDQKDVRAVQLAKAAIYAGMVTLLQNANVKEEEIEDFYIAGGFGNKIDINKAVNIGMFPASFRNIATVMGNAALTGAQRLLYNQNEISTLHTIKQSAITVDLATNKVFQDAYIDNMLFEM